MHFTCHSHWRAAASGVDQRAIRFVVQRGGPGCRAGTLHRNAAENETGRLFACGLESSTSGAMVLRSTGLNSYERSCRQLPFLPGSPRRDSRPKKSTKTRTSSPSKTSTRKPPPTSSSFPRNISRDSKKPKPLTLNSSAAAISPPPTSPASATSSTDTAPSSTSAPAQDNRSSTSTSTCSAAAPSPGHPDEAVFLNPEMLSVQAGKTQASFVLCL